MAPTLKIRVLGSGTSTGVPVIGCTCYTCCSRNVKDKRTRASILVRYLNQDLNLVVDTAPEFRLQMLEAKVRDLRHVLYTHTHADHCHGFDDLRAFYFFSKTPVNCYLAKEHAKELRSRFSYAFEDTGYIGTPPQVKLKTITARGFSIKGAKIDVKVLPHGSMETLAFRFGSFAYATDFKYFPSKVIASWRGKIDTMVASALRFSEHPTHSSIPETLELFKELGVRRGILTHLSHDICYKRDFKKIPKNVSLAYDGMEIVI